MSKQVRMPDVDFMKGCAIILVVLAHFIQWNYENVYMGENNTFHPLYAWIYSFHMPVFFFISAYLLSMKPISSNYISIKKKFLGLFIPYSVWCFVISGLTSWELKSWKVYFDVDGCYWFIMVLFLMALLFNVYDFVIKKLKVQNTVLSLIILCLVYGLNLLFYSLYSCNLFFRAIAFAPFFLMGILCGKFFDIKKHLGNKTLLCIVLLIFAISSLTYGHHEIPKVLSDISKIFAGISATLVFLACANSSLVNYESKWVRNICYCGKNSIVIYLTHFSCLGLMEAAFIPTNLLSPFWCFFLSLVPSLIIILFVLLFGRFIEFFPWFNRILYGRGW